MEPADTMENVASHQPQSGLVTDARVDAQTPTVRYMSDEAFDRCLQKVLRVHDRLLAKLAE